MKLLGSCAAAVVVLLAATPASAADPFDEARYDIGIKKNAEALAIVDRGAFDINMQTSEGFTLLHYAADAGNFEMVKALLARGANPSLRSNAGRTALDMATAPLVQAELRRVTAGAASSGRSPAIAGAARTRASAAPASSGAQHSAAPAGADAARRKECNQKWHADQALASDTTAKMATYRKWQQCLKTGRYW